MNSNATPQETVDALYAAFGDHHSRAVHAKGIILEGTFTPNPAAADLSEAALFSGASVPVTARFSNFTGIPDIPDTVGEASPRGLGLKFKVPNDAEVNVVAHSFDGFPVKTAADSGNCCSRSPPAEVMLPNRPRSIGSWPATRPRKRFFRARSRPR